MDSHAFIIGVVYYYRGDFKTWSLQQILRAPKDDLADSSFGLALDLDPVNLRTLAVGCENCNSSGLHTGSVVLFEPFTPQASQWTQTQILTSSSLFYLGGTDVEMYDDLILADYCVVDADPCTTFNKKVMLFEKVGDDWDTRQTLGYKTPGAFSPNDYSVKSFAVYDDTIVLGVSDYDITYGTARTNVGAVYVLQPGIPSGKPQPRQWSIQQVLFSPSPTANHLFGSDVSIDGDTMIISDGQGTPNIYVYERETSHGKWSLQQTIVGSAAVSGLELRGSAFSTVEGTTMKYYHQTSTWDCVIFELDDHFGDGWDIARLTVEVPKGVQTLQGDIDSFEPRCDLPNPITFRYCPKDAGDVGPYRVSVKDGPLAKHHWEILWRVFEERTGLWFTGKWDTTIDMVWTNEKKFEIKKVSKELPYNITCRRCPPRPTAKPTPVLRRLKSSDDDTRAPTYSPAPTVKVTDDHVNWRYMTLMTADAAKPWFDKRHIGASYYVSDEKAHKLLHVGTMCPGQPTTLDCWVDLPDGIYTVRVGGALSPDESAFTWKYCKYFNPIDASTQMVIEISYDDCRVLAHHTRASYCSIHLNFDPSVVVAVELLILGATTSENYQSNNILVVQETLSNAIPGVSIDDIKVLSITNIAQGIVVLAHMTMTSTKTGYNFAEYEGYLSLKNLQAYLQGDGGSILRAGLISGSHANSFTTASSVHLLSFEIVSSLDIPLTKELPNREVVSFADLAAQDLVEGPPNQLPAQAEFIINGLALIGYFVAGTVILFMGIIIASKIAKMRKATAEINFHSTSEDNMLENSTSRLPKNSSRFQSSNKVAINNISFSYILQSDSRLPMQNISY